MKGHLTVIEQHPDWYYPIDNMKTLILGTFPPYKDRWDYPFYYPNKANNFWRVLARVGSVSLNEWSGEKAVVERQKLMEKLKVGVQNLGLIVQRINHSSLDRDITIIEYQNILEIISSNKNLQKIHLTGYSGKTSTYHSFIKYLNLHGLKYSEPKIVRSGYEFTLNFEKPISCIIGNSTSPTARRGGITFDMLCEHFKKTVIF